MQTFSRIRVTAQVFCWFLILLVANLSLHAQITSPSSQSEQNHVLKVGAATSKITPPIGSIMGNSYGITIAEGVCDDLYSKALILEKGDVKAVLIALDLISLP